MQNTTRRGIYVKIDNSGAEVARRKLIEALYINGSEEYGVKAHDRRSVMNFINSDRITPKQNIPFQIVFQCTSGLESSNFVEDTSIVDSIVAKAAKKATERVKAS